MTLFRIRLRKPRKIDLGDYKPYEPWNELEPLKSANWWAEKPETEETKGTVVNKDDKKERKIDYEPGVLWGWNVYKDKWGV